MDSEVKTMSVEESSLSIDSSSDKGFSLFFVTFEGSLQMKQEGSADKRYKLSFMVEGYNSGEQPVVTVKATKMNVNW